MCGEYYCGSKNSDKGRLRRALAKVAMSQAIWYNQKAVKQYGCL